MYAAMCSICRDVLHGLIAHEEIRCPLRLSQYCCICARYGHRTIECPTKENRLLRIHHNDIKEFLVKHGIKPGKNNQRLLTEYADVSRKRIIYQP
jgi:RNA:NAD 2'-phosphotransferase (TPT1/KptA family)